MYSKYETKVFIIDVRFTTQKRNKKKTETENENQIFTIAIRTIAIYNHNLKMKWKRKTWINLELGNPNWHTLYLNNYVINEISRKFILYDNLMTQTQYTRRA